MGITTCTVVEKRIKMEHRWTKHEESVEDIGAIVDFDEEEEDSDPDAEELIYELNHVINISSEDAEEDGSLMKKNESTYSEEGAKDIEKKSQKSNENEERVGKENDNIYENLYDISQANVATNNDIAKDDRVSFTSMEDCIKKDNENNNIGIYENYLASCIDDENLYEEIIPNESIDNYINFCSISNNNENTSQCLGTEEKLRRMTSLLKQSNTYDFPTKRWSIPSGGQALRSILKQGDRKSRNQRIFFRGKVKVKRFEDVQDTCYEPVEVVDYVPIAGHEENIYDEPKSLLKPFPCEDSYEEIQQVIKTKTGKEEKKCAIT